MPFGSEVTTIAFHLPQFHPTPENDQWWEPGFTEWTLTTRAKPLFRGHSQPRHPGRLGFYDLRLAEARDAQGRLAAQYGVDAFCYWHYWFGDGVRFLAEVVDAVVETGYPSNGFCLGWANEDLTATWRGRPGSVLQKQRYPSGDDDLKHFDAVEAAFHSPRYLRVDGKPLFYIYRPIDHPDLAGFIERWRKRAESSGLGGVYFVAEATGDNLTRLSCDIDAVVVVDWTRAFRSGDRIRRPRRGPLRESYARAATDFPGTAGPMGKTTFPCVLTGWDNTPRHGRAGVVLTGRTPTLFADQVRSALKLVPEPPLLFIKSWNEWSEGNYLEPDNEQDTRYLDALASAFRSPCHQQVDEPLALP
ncbi:hypothetical protein ABH935_007102 [Catenulispora sp. GAS73]|uniref:glycosyltransferase WbsX family protein n=1 Tax=Catenulispora sp. GAS73 TaxID=3156269 RepID=UPI0035129AB9